MFGDAVKLVHIRTWFLMRLAIAGYACAAGRSASGNGGMRQTARVSGTAQGITDSSSARFARAYS